MENDDEEQIDRRLAEGGTFGMADALHAPSPVDEVMAREAGDDGMDAARAERETLRKMLLFFFAHGCTLESVFQQVVFLTKIIAPEILRGFGKESFEELGKCLGLGRAAMSANYKQRIVKLVEVSERRSGRSRPSFRANFQKNATACGRMADAQKGNKNRKKKQTTKL